MKQLSAFSVIVAMIVVVLLGYGTLESREATDAATRLNASELSAGYSLLYELVSQEKQASLVSIIKKESPELKSLLERISETPRPRPRSWKQWPG